jgi:hypothetical protein
MTFNPGLNLESFAVRSTSSAPPPLNALYLRDGKYDGVTRADVAAFFTAFRAQSATTRLALFFHGGLVDKASGQQGAANQYEAYKDIVFPLFFIWESGIWEVLAHHLPLIFAETIFGRIVDHVTGLLSGKLSQAQAAGRAGQFSLEASFNQTPSGFETISFTSDDVDQFMTAIKNDEKIQQEAVAIARTSTSVESLLSAGAKGKLLQLSRRTYLSPQVVGAIRGAYIEGNRSSVGTGQPIESVPFGIGGAIQAAWAIAKAAAPALISCVKRFVAKRDHGLTCTIVEEVLRALYLANTGSSIWEEMKRETEDAFGADSNQFGGTAVIEELCLQLKQKPATAITLVGHSTGAIYIGNFLRHVDIALTSQGDSTTVFDIVLMAPASTVDFFVINYKNRMRGVRIFQMQDATEQQDHLMSKDVGPSDPSILGRVYPRSLLYLVSGICEYFEGQGGSGVHEFDGDDMPILGMDRFFAQSSVFTAANYPSVGQVRPQFSVAPPPPGAPSKYVRVLSPTTATPDDGYRSGSEKHGNFPGDGPTIASIRLCFQNGL